MDKILFKYAASLSQIFNPRLNILMYHRVMPKPDTLRPWEIDKEEFRKQMAWISGVYNVVPLSKALRDLKAGDLKRRTLAITFDDGYLDNVTEALPILKEFGFHATFFCTSAWLNGGLMWNDQVIESIRNWPEDSLTLKELGIDQLPIKRTNEKNEAIAHILPRLKYLEAHSRQDIADKMAAKAGNLPNLMMPPEGIKKLYEQGMEIGGHTHSHPIIANIDDKTLERQLSENKECLENIIGENINIFAYPNGKPEKDYRKDQINLIKKIGYSAALTTFSTSADKNTDLFQIPRFTPWDKTKFRFMARLFLT